MRRHSWDEQYWHNHLVAGDQQKKEAYMICENCKIDSDMFGHICSVCGGEIESNPVTTENKIPDSSPTATPAEATTESPAEKKILTSLEIKENRAKKIARILWLID